MRKFKIELVNKGIEPVINQQISLILRAESESEAWKIANNRIAKFIGSEYASIEIDKLVDVTDNQKEKEQIYKEVRERVTIPFEAVQRLIIDDMFPWKNFRNRITMK